VELTCLACKKHFHATSSHPSFIAIDVRCEHCGALLRKRVGATKLITHPPALPVASTQTIDARPADPQWLQDLRVKRTEEERSTKMSGRVRRDYGK